MKSANNSKWYTTGKWKTSIELSRSIKQIQLSLWLNELCVNFNIRFLTIIHAGRLQLYGGRFTMENDTIMTEEPASLENLKVSLNSFSRGAGNQWSDCMPLFVWLGQVIRPALKPSRQICSNHKDVLPCNDMSPNHWSQIPLIYLFSSTLRSILEKKL